MKIVSFLFSATIAMCCFWFYYDGVRSLSKANPRLRLVSTPVKTIPLGHKVTPAEIKLVFLRDSSKKNSSPPELVIGRYAARDLKADELISINDFYGSPLSSNDSLTVILKTHSIYAKSIPIGVHIKVLAGSKLFPVSATQFFRVTDIQESGESAAIVAIVAKSAFDVKALSSKDDALVIPVLYKK